VAYKSFDMANTCSIISLFLHRQPKVNRFQCRIDMNKCYTKRIEFGGRLDAEILTQFVDAGGNVLVAGSNSIGKTMCANIDLIVSTIGHV
jgi:pentose-5-phosphate-3-epimerase